MEYERRMNVTLAMIIRYAGFAALGFLIGWIVYDIIKYFAGLRHREEK